MCDVWQFAKKKKKTKNIGMDYYIDHNLVQFMVINIGYIKIY